jgi:hypothetical protein
MQSNRINHELTGSGTEEGMRVLEWLVKNTKVRIRLLESPAGDISVKGGNFGIGNRLVGMLNPRQARAA